MAHFDYGDNWTAFFRTGSHVPLPPIAAHEHIYLLQGEGSGGYDGQYYRLIAQDPFILHGTAQYIDAPRLRYRRILLPAFAFLLAFGNPTAATYTYIAAVLFFLALGTYWLSRYAGLLGRDPWWGLAYLFVPAVFLSLDRLTTDIALATLTVGFALYVRSGPPLNLFFILLLASLAKETGILLLAAYCAYLAFQKQWLRSAWMACAGIPAALWALYVHSRTLDYPASWIQLPFQAALETILGPKRYLGRPWFIAPIEYIAWAGMLLAILIAVARLNKERPLNLAAFLLAVLAMTVNASVWVEAEAFGRVFSPLLILLPLEQPTLYSLIPLLAILPRTSTYLVSETAGVFRAILR